MRDIIASVPQTSFPESGGLAPQTLLASAANFLGAGGKEKDL